MAALTYRERLQELRRELADLSRAFKGEEGAGSMFLDIVAGAVKDALGELPRAALGRLMPGAPGSLKAGLEPARGAAPAASEGGRGLRPSEPAGTPVGPAVSEREAPKAAADRGPPAAAVSSGPPGAAVHGKRRVNPCSRCGQPGHRMDNKTFHPPDGAAAQSAETPASDDEDPEPDAAADLPPYRQAASSDFGPSDEEDKEEECVVGAHSARLETIEEFPGAPLVRARRACGRCGQPGHRRDTCDVDLTDARLKDIAAAAVRLGLAPPPEPRVLPVVAPAPPEETAPSAWDRADPDQDLTDLDLGVPEAEPPTPPPAPAAPVLVLVPPPPAAGPDPTPALARARDKLAARAASGFDRHRGSITIAGALSQEERREGSELLDPGAYDRPGTRGDCLGGGFNAARPCPWASCHHHLAVDVADSSGSLVVNHPHLEVWEMAETCSLDVADRGGITLKEVGAILNLTRERIRQVEVTGLEKIRKHSGDDLEGAPERFSSPLGEAID